MSVLQGSWLTFLGIWILPDRPRPSAFSRALRSAAVSNRVVEIASSSSAPTSTISTARPLPLPLGSSESLSSSPPSPWRFLRRSMPRRTARSSILSARSSAVVGFSGFCPSPDVDCICNDPFSCSSDSFFSVSSRRSSCSFLAYRVSVVISLLLYPSPHSQCKNPVASASSTTCPAHDAAATPPARRRSQPRAAPCACPSCGSTRLRPTLLPSHCIVPSVGAASLPGPVVVVKRQTGGPLLPEITSLRHFWQVTCRAQYKSCANELSCLAKS